MKDKKDLHTYHLKLTTLTPVHIGTGESYEPTSFVIDGGTLYEFDEVLFYKSLSDVDKKALNNKMSNWLQIIEFYKTKKEQAKEISFFECPVSKEVQSKYDAKNPNQLQINRTFKNPNTHRAIIPGSSIKGMLDTVFGIYPPKSSNEERQKLVISDALVLNGGVEIGYSYRKHRVKNEGGKIPQMVEVIKPNSTFILTMASKLTFQEIQQFMKKYHHDRANSIYKEDSKSFIARVGKYSGMEYMVDYGKNLKNSYGKPLATYSIYESDMLKDEMFGWVKFELIDKDEYKNSLADIQKQEEDYYNRRDEKQKKVLQAIHKAEYEAKEKALEKKRLEEEEKKRLEDEKAKREAELATMSPVEKEIELLIENHPNTPKNTLIFNNIISGNLDKYKCEALKMLKKWMQDNKEWKESTKAKRPEKDKNYQRTLKVIQMQKECS